MINFTRMRLSEFFVARVSFFSFGKKKDKLHFAQQANVTFLLVCFFDREFNAD